MLTQKDCFIQNLSALDLNPIAYKLMNPEGGEGLTPQLTKQAIAQYLMFLCLVSLYPHQPLVPTLLADQVWHCHILDTAKYVEDCQMLFGRFIHHFPYFGVRSESDRQQLNTNFTHTQDLLKQHFELSINTKNEEPKPSGCIIINRNQPNQRPQASLNLDALQLLEEFSG